MHAKPKTVTLVEHPSRDNGYFYVVKNKNDRFYVSALFGKEATGLPVGSKLKLGYMSNKNFGAYTLGKA